MLDLQVNLLLHKIIIVWEPIFFMLRRKHRKEKESGARAITQALTRMILWSNG